MITTIADKVVRGYVKEACDILDFDMSNVLILYVPQITANAGIREHVAKYIAR